MWLIAKGNNVECVLNASWIWGAGVGACRTPPVTGKRSVGSEARIGVSAVRGSQDHSDGHVQYVFIPTRGLYSSWLCVVFVGLGSGNTLFTQQNWEVQRTTEAFVCLFFKKNPGRFC